LPYALRIFLKDTDPDPFYLLVSFCVDVHFGLAQNEPKTQEEFNSIGLAADITVEPVSCRTDFKQKFFSFGLLLSSLTATPGYCHLSFSTQAQVSNLWQRLVAGGRGASVPYIFSRGATE